MDDSTLALIVTQAVVFFLFIVSEILGISSNIPYNAIVQMVGIFKKPEEPQKKVNIVELRKSQNA